MATVVNNPTTRSMGLAALILTAFAVVGTGVVALTYSGTREIILESERQALLDNLNALVDPARYDNHPTEDTLVITAPEALGTTEPVTVYRARMDGQPVALMAAPIAPDGYGGPIRLLVGINRDATVAGVRVLAHKETPGLGDGIEVERSDWIRGFEGKSLSNPEPGHWAVKKDGGTFDQFTGATITPRAVVGAVKRFLEYYQANRERLFLATDTPVAGTPVAGTPVAGTPVAGTPVAGTPVEAPVHAPPPDPAAPTSPGATGPTDTHSQDPTATVEATPQEEDRP